MPDMLKKVMEVRIWWQEKMVHSVAFPLGEFHGSPLNLQLSTFQLFLTWPQAGFQLALRRWFEEEVADLKAGQALEVFPCQRAQSSGPQVVHVSVDRGGLSASGIDPAPQ